MRGFSDSLHTHFWVFCFYFYFYEKLSLQFIYTNLKILILLWISLKNAHLSVGDGLINALDIWVPSSSIKRGHIWCFSCIWLVEPGNYEPSDVDSTIQDLFLFFWFNPTPPQIHYGSLEHTLVWNATNGQKKQTWYARKGKVPLVRYWSEEMIVSRSLIATLGIPFICCLILMFIM